VLLEPVLLFDNIEASSTSVTISSASAASFSQKFFARLGAAVEALVGEVDLSLGSLVTLSFLEDARRASVARRSAASHAVATGPAVWFLMLASSTRERISGVILANA